MMKDSSILTQECKYLMLALDHRGSFQKLLGVDVSDEQVIDAKYQIIEALYNDFSGILIDPKWGLPAYQQFVQEKKIKNPKPYLLSIEKTGYADEEGERITELEYSVKQLKEMGASGVKILLYFNPHAESSRKQLETAKKVLDDCHNYNLPLFLEIVTYVPTLLSSRANETERGDLNEIASSSFDFVQDKQAPRNDKGELIINSVQAFLDFGVRADVFKLEFPGDERSCRKITEMLGSTPWILLTRGASFEQFKNELKIASENGVQGFLAGRSMWQEFPNYQGENRKEFLNATVKKRFQELKTIMIQ